MHLAKDCQWTFKDDIKCPKVHKEDPTFDWECDPRIMTCAHGQYTDEEPPNSNAVDGLYRPTTTVTTTTRQTNTPLPSTMSTFIETSPKTTPTQPTSVESTTPSSTTVTNQRTGDNNPNDHSKEGQSLVINFNPSLVNSIHSPEFSNGISGHQKKDSLRTSVIEMV